MREEADETLRDPVAIIGNGAAAAEAVVALRAHGYQGEIHLFADNEHAPYNPMLGPYLVAGAIPVQMAFPFGDERGFYGANGVTAHLGLEVVRLDAAERTLTTSDGRTHRYGRCLVASGARPSVPPVHGLREALAPPRANAGGSPAEVASAELASVGPATARPATAGLATAGSPKRRVFTLQSLDDALNLKRAVDELRSRAAGGRVDRGSRRPTDGEAARVAVVGASFAGVKVAAAFREMGFEVCLVEREPRVLPLSAHRQCARLMEARLLGQGYELRLGAALASVDAGGSKVRLNFGTPPGASHPGGYGPTRGESSAHEEVDLAVICTGSRPSLGFLAPGQVDTDVGILVDEQSRSSVPTLYAAGDAAQGANLLTGRREIIGLWVSARCQGRAAGRSLAGAPSPYRGSVPHNITQVGGMLFASLGCLKEYDRIETAREGDAFQVRVWQDGRLVGINLLDRCLAAGAMKQALLRAAAGTATGTEVTWTTFSA